MTIKLKYKYPPLPFIGNKSYCKQQLIQLLSKFDDNTVFVDLFGGSLYCSYIVHCMRPNARVICNDYDNYKDRLNHISETNMLLHRIYAAIDKKKYVNKRSMKLAQEDTNTVKNILHEWSSSGGYIDNVTLCSKLLFQNSVINIMDNIDKNITLFYRGDCSKFYNDVTDYTEGLELVCCDWQQLFDKWKDKQNVCFICDPPYLYTDKTCYKDLCKYWKLADSLQVHDVLTVNNSFVFFTCTESGTIELVKYIDSLCPGKIKSYEMIECTQASKRKPSSKDLLMFRYVIDNVNNVL